MTFLRARFVNIFFSVRFCRFCMVIL